MRFCHSVGTHGGETPPLPEAALELGTKTPRCLLKRKAGGEGKGHWSGNLSLYSGQWKVGAEQSVKVAKRNTCINK